MENCSSMNLKTAEGELGAFGDNFLNGKNKKLKPHALSEVLSHSAELVKPNLNIVILT